MQTLTKGVYYVKKGHRDAPNQTRLWHDCKVRGMRVELEVKSETPDEIGFCCPRCDFVYTLDKNLNVA